jgi:hypothetical protein
MLEAAGNCLVIEAGDDYELVVLAIYVEDFQAFNVRAGGF